MQSVPGVQEKQKRPAPGKGAGGVMCPGSGIGCSLRPGRGENKTARPRKTGTGRESEGRVQSAGGGARE